MGRSLLPMEALELELEEGLLRIRCTDEYGSRERSVALKGKEVAP